MPRLNTLGQATTGYQTCWFDDQRTIAQVCTETSCRILLSDGTVIAEHGANYVYAQNGTWVSFLNGRGVDLSGETLPEAGLTRACDPVGPDGSIAIKTIYNSFGPWEILGAGVTFGGDCQFVQNLGNGRVLWTEGNWLRSLGLVVPDMQCYWPRWKDGRFLYQAFTGELVFENHVIAPVGAYYRPDFMVREDGALLIVWSSNEGESDVISRILTTAELAALPLYGSPTPEPQPSAGTMVKAFEHAFWLSVFYMLGQHHGDTPAEFRTGNAILLVEKEDDPGVLIRDLDTYQPLGKPMIVQGDEQPIPQRFWNQIVAWWARGQTVEQLGERVTRALEQPWKVPVNAYLDGAWSGPRPHWMTDAVRPNVQAYPREDETTDQFVARIEPMIALVKGYSLPWGLTLRFDDPDQSGPRWTVDEILACCPTYERWIRAYQPAFVDLFAGMRGDGFEALRARGDDRIYQWAKAFTYAVPCGQPGRYDNLSEPADAATKMAVLGNKLAQSRSLKTIEPWLAGDLLVGMRAYYEGAEPEPGDFVAPENMLLIVEAVWARYGGTAGHRGTMLNDIAWQGNNGRSSGPWGLSRKDGGNHTEQPHTGAPVASDIVQFGPTNAQTGHAEMYDCFRDTGPVWLQAEQHENPARVWVAAVEP